LFSHNVRRARLWDTKVIDQEREQRRQRLSILVRDYFGDDNDIVECVIREMTSKQVTVRSIQTWLIPPHRTSSRNTPEWAIRALEDYINRPGNDAILKARVARLNELRVRQSKSPREWGHEIRSNKSVEFAEMELQHESRDRQAWIDLAGKQLGDELHQQFGSLQRILSSQTRAIGMIMQAIDQCATIEELRNHVNGAVIGDSVGAMAVRSAKEALKAGAEEFSNEEGLPTAP
jgi:hypothetical protein